MILGVIPARYNSTRLPGKPLIDICGKPLIQHVHDEVKKSKYIEKLIVATDDMRIVNACNEFQADVVLTSSDHKSGTDRVFEVASGYNCDYVVNIQGDEPLIKAEMIDSLICYAISHRHEHMVTGCVCSNDQDIINNPNTVKVVVDKNDNALYFSRSPIPHHPPQEVGAKIHVGIYVFRNDFIKKFKRMPTTSLSKVESLEQLKVLENGYSIKVIQIDSPEQLISVDTDNDLKAVIAHMKNKKNMKETI